MEVKPGYKQTVVGVIPEDWDVRSIERVFSLKNGFAFSSEYFSGTGPIVLTPGNFRLEGGLYFEDRNTKRYAGNYSQEMKFLRGDLLIVMTDLTPTCNLLGKPAFVDTDEAILHNQRIGKVLLKDKSVHLPFLYYLLLSRPYLDHIREQAFGSTVRHTSNKSIYSAQLAWPPPPEQQAIAAALSDVDMLLGELDRLVAKKRDLKQAAMQQLLTGLTRLPDFHGEWEVKRLGKLAEIVSGGTPRTTEPSYWNGGIQWCTPTDITGCTGKYLRETERTISRLGLHNCGARLLLAGALLLCSRATIGEVRIASRETCTNQGFKSLVCTEEVSNEFLYYKLLTLKQKMLERAFGSTFLEISKGNLAAIEANMPLLPEQTAIATVLSDMDAELTALEARRDKTRDLKKAMMQELLTGKTRLVATGGAHA